MRAMQTGRPGPAVLECAIDVWGKPTTVNGAALSSNVVDKVFFYYAPKLLIGEGSIPFAAGAANGSKVPPLQNLRLHRFGDDFAVEGYLRDPYEE